jgi:hypothetical protein
MLERYLDNLTSYAETVFDPSSEIINEFRGGEDGSVGQQRRINPIHPSSQSIPQSLEDWGGHLVPGASESSLKYVQVNASDIFSLPADNFPDGYSPERIHNPSLSQGEVWRRRRSGGAFRAFQQKGQVFETAVANNKMVRLILYNPSHFVENHKGESVTLVQRKIKILNYPGSPWDWESSGLVRAKITTKEMLYSNR